MHARLGSQFSGHPSVRCRPVPVCTLFIDHLLCIQKCSMSDLSEKIKHSPSPDVSVVVPVRNGEGDIEECLRRIKRSVGCSFEIVVVNDASTDRTRAIAEGLGVRVITLQERSGPAVARNRAVRECEGEVVVFVDCDVMIRSDTLLQLKSELAENQWAAVFGSYDRHPKAGNLVSVYKNLMHHFYHQGSSREAQTFWSGCGAVRRDVFDQFGGFNEAFAMPSIEDIEFGMRISKAGCVVGSVPEIQVQHTKQWTLKSLLYTDVFLRGIPWTRLMLRAGNIPDDLNVGRAQRVSVSIAGLIVCVFTVLVCLQPALLILPLCTLGLLFVTDVATVRQTGKQLILWIGAFLLLGLVVLSLVLQPLLALVFLGVACIGIISHKSLRFLSAVGGVPFAILCLALHVTYFLYCGFSFAAGTVLHSLGIPFFREST